MVDLHKDQKILVRGGSIHLNGKGAGGCSGLAAEVILLRAPLIPGVPNNSRIGRITLRGQKHLSFSNYNTGFLYINTSKEGLALGDSHIPIIDTGVANPSTGLPVRLVPNTTNTGLLHHLSPTS